MFQFHVLETYNDNNIVVFEKLYEKYKIELMRYAMSLTKNHYDAEDLCQETWLVVAKRFDSLKNLDEDSIKAYIVKIMKNTYFDYLRKKTKNEEYIASDSVDFIDSKNLSLDAILLDICMRETVDTISKCINALDEKYRDVLDFYYFKQSSSREIAEFLHIDVRTVRKRVER